MLCAPASASRAEDCLVGGDQLIERGLGVPADCARGLVAVSGIGLRDPHISDSTDIVERCVTYPMRADVKRLAPRRVFVQAVEERVEPAPAQRTAGLVPEDRVDGGVGAA